MSLDYLCSWQVQVSVLGAYMRIFGVPSVQSCGTLSISASYFVFVNGRYRKSRFVCVGVGPGFVSTSSASIRSNASHPVGPHGPLAKKTVNWAPIDWLREVLTQFAKQFVNAVTVPPLVGCVVRSLVVVIIIIIIMSHLS